MDYRELKPPYSGNAVTGEIRDKTNNIVATFRDPQMSLNVASLINAISEGTYDPGESDYTPIEDFCTKIIEEAGN
ncbi:MAG: hypothetical protein LBT53_05870 [Puniceicoccales bacterium]|jgi:hypothetical protein|nr:hypothetical protein [Puniceicoccales bacterium]